MIASGCVISALYGTENSIDVKDKAKVNDSIPQKVQTLPENIDPNSRLLKKCPTLAASIITKVYEKGKLKGIVLVDRGRPPLGQAIPGGLVRYEETFESCAKRTLFDECGILRVSNLTQFNVYSNPQRDPRMQVIDTVFTARVDDVVLSAGTDAKHAWICPLDKIPWDTLAFDHRDILKDFLEYELSSRNPIVSTEPTQSASVDIKKQSRNENDFRTIAKKSFHPPFSASSVIIESYKKGVFEGIILIDRGKEPLGKAIPGGHVEYGEMVDFTATREMREECNLDVKDLKLFKVYSDKDRDPRKHTVDFIQIGRVDDVTPKAGDDAAKIYIYPLDKIPWNELVFDHKQILQDYIRYRSGDTAGLCAACR